MFVDLFFLFFGFYSFLSVAYSANKMLHKNSQVDIVELYLMIKSLHMTDHRTRINLDFGFPYCVFVFFSSSSSYGFSFMGLWLRVEECNVCLRSNCLYLYQLEWVQYLFCTTLMSNVPLLNIHWLCLRCDLMLIILCLTSHTKQNAENIGVLNKGYKSFEFLRWLVINPTCKVLWWTHTTNNKPL